MSCEGLGFGGAQASRPANTSQLKSFTHMKFLQGVLGAVALVLAGDLVVQAQKDFLVCGDSKLLVVDYLSSKDSIPAIRREWDASRDADLPEIFRTRKFRSMDDCKVSPDGKQLLVSSSSGGVALLHYPEMKVVFFTEVGNAHSIEFLPGGLIAVAGSTHPQGNKVAIFNPAVSDQPLAQDSLYSGHGVVWHAKKKLLYALGLDVLRAYTVESDARGIVRLTKTKEWKIEGQSGHDLFLTADGKQLYITEHTGVWTFDLKKEKFGKMPDFPDKPDIKSIGRNREGQILYTQPEESWWTFSVKTLHPERKFVIPGLKIYKARWVKL